MCSLVCWIHVVYRKVATIQPKVADISFSKKEEEEEEEVANITISTGTTYEWSPIVLFGSHY